MTQINPNTMTPQEYLRFVQANAVESQLGRFRKNDAETGLRTESVNGIPYAYIQDEEHYRSFLRTSRHLTPDEVDKILAKDKEVEKYYLDGVANYSTRLYNASDFAKSF